MTKRTQTAAIARLPAAYWRLWWAAAADNVGDGVFAAALPLLTVTITRNPVLISLVSAATYLPWLLLSLPAGAIVDRRDRVSLMWQSQVLQAVIVASVTVLLAAGKASIPVLAVMGFGLGACEVIFANASVAVLPEIVPAALLSRANGSQYTVASAGQLFIGPPVGSLLFAAAAALPFGVDAGSFVLSAGLLATLPRRPRARAAQPPVRTAIADGVRWLGRHRLLRTLAGLLAVNTFCFQMGNVTVILLATQVLHVSNLGYGLLLAGARGRQCARWGGQRRHRRPDRTAVGAAHRARRERPHLRRHRNQPGRRSTGRAARAERVRHHHVERRDRQHAPAHRPP
jgi:hypothetical protein